MYRITENPPGKTESAREVRHVGESFYHRLRGVCMEQMEDGFGGAQSKEIVARGLGTVIGNGM